MPCPFITGDQPYYCGASQTSYVPEAQEARISCKNEAGENYRLCKHFRRAVWSGLAPTFLPQQRPKDE